MTRTDPPRATIPRATYRLQLHAGFDFDAARALLPYLERLGISHVYCSPISTAVPGSQHGYDVVDPTRINPELGGRERFERFAEAARERGLGLLVDQVPNHMGIWSPENRWWADVLTHGEASAYARFFDILWQPADPTMAGKVLMPVLGDSYGETLDGGRLRLALDAEAGRLEFVCGDHRLPIDPRTQAATLAGPDAPPPLAALAAEFAALPPRDALDPASTGHRRDGAEALRHRFARVLADHPEAEAHVAARLDAVNTAPDRDALDALHEAQAYRLVHWGAAADDINYRRFFDVNSLAALRIEDPAVFEETQRLALDLAADGWIDGLRIDHPDGLLDPGDYFQRLQRGYLDRLAARARPPADADVPGTPDTLGARTAADGEPSSTEPDPTVRPPAPLYVVAEKIAAGFEDLPIHWPLHGATGYRFAMLSTGLMVERRHALRMERLWRSFGEASTPYEEIVQVAKRRAARVALGAQATELAHALRRIARDHRESRDFGLDALRYAIVEVATAMPVYRTYIRPGAPPTEQDRRFIDWAVARAKQTGELPDPALFDFVRQALLGIPPRGASEETEKEVRHFAMRFQQYSSPVAAKGVEDTAFYRYHRLVALNEVGGDPGVFGISAAAFHGAAADRAARWPHTLLGTSTHDNKRSEDVRARLAVLSEQVPAWHRGLKRWQVATRSFRTTVDGREAPSAADQVLLHQTLLGSLPAGGLTEATLPGYRDRIEAYMTKAVCEAKLETRWTRRNEPYEAALTGFVRALLARVDGNPVLAELQARADDLAWFGALNSLATTVLKLTSPGVPDIYQGTELIDLSLVDPDNRRPVDYDARRALLDRFETADGPDRPVPVDELTADPTDGRLKLWTIWRLLQCRRERPALFGASTYQPLRVHGTRRRHALAYARRDGDDVLIVAVGRKFAGLGRPAGTWPVGAEVWGDTALVRPSWLRDGTVGHDVLSGRSVRLSHAADGKGLALAPLFADWPFAAVRVRLEGRPSPGERRDRPRAPRSERR